MTTTRKFRPATIASLLAAIIAISVLALLSPKPAEAAFPGDNGRIAYYTGGDVWTMEPDGSGQAKLTTNYNYEGNPAVSPDGSKIVYEFLGAVWIMNADGSGKTRLTDGAATDEGPVFSGDGERIAFSRGGDIWAMDADGSGETNLTNTSENAERDPSWSPDGGKIAYTRIGCDVPRGGGNCVYVMNADGSGQTNLTPEKVIPGCENSPGYSHFGSGKDPSFSPDGTRIVFSGSLICPHTIGRDIWTMNSNGSNKVNLTNDHATGEIQPAFSPDGSKIIFVSDENSSNLELYSMNSDGSAMTRLTSDAVRQDNPDWAVPPSDGDGVPDYADEWPETPAPGEPDGCPNTSPVISGMKPAPSSTVRDATPTISAFVRDGEAPLQKGDIQLYVDGKRKTVFSYDPSAEKLSHASARLSKGRHSIKITATDAQSMSASKTWNFKVK